MDDEKTTSEAQGQEVQELVSETPAAPAVEVAQEPVSEAQPQVVQEESAEAKAEQERREQSERDSDRNWREVQQQLYQANQTIQRLERTFLGQQTQAEQSRLVELKATDPDAYTEQLEQRINGFGQAVGNVARETQENLWQQTLAQPQFAKLTREQVDRVIQDAAVELAKDPRQPRDERGYVIVTYPQAIAALTDHVANSHATKAGSMEAELKTMREEIAALKNDNAGARLSADGGPPSKIIGAGGEVDLNEARRAYSNGDMSTSEAKALGIV